MFTDFIITYIKFFWDMKYFIAYIAFCSIAFAFATGIFNQTEDAKSVNEVNKDVNLPNQNIRLMHGAHTESYLIDEENITVNNTQIFKSGASFDIKLPSDFNGEYNYYFKNPVLYLEDIKGDIYHIKTMGIAVKIDDPVKIICFASPNKDSPSNTYTDDN